MATTSKNIVLVGPMGSGKTTIGRRLAHELNRDFFDTDHEIIEKNITCDDIYNADEAFFTGTAAEVTPVRELDGRKIGSGTRGSVTQKLQSLYFDCVYGRNNQYLYWLAKGRCS